MKERRRQEQGMSREEEEEEEEEEIHCVLNHAQLFLRFSFSFSYFLLFF